MLQPEQFVGFNLEPKCFLHTTMIDAATNEPLEGVKIQLIILEDELQNLIEPPKVWLTSLVAG